MRQFQNQAFVADAASVGGGTAGFFNSAQQPASRRFAATGF